jgi:hypothetical protein
MSQSSDSARVAITIALITTIGAIVAAVLGGPLLVKQIQSGNTNDSNKANYIVESNYDKPTNFDFMNWEMTVYVDGQEIGTIYTFQQPIKLTESIDEGNHPYSLTGILHDAQWEGEGCYDGGEISGSGNLSIQDGDRYRVSFAGSCSKARLNEVN